MLYILAYVLVIPLTILVLSLGVAIGSVVALPISVIGYIFPKSFRDHIIVPFSIFLTGILGVGCSVAFGYFVFRWLVGSSSFTLLPFLAATLPLYIPITNDIAQCRRNDAARRELISGLLETRSLAEAEEVAEVVVSNRPAIFGYFVGLVLAASWFIYFHGGLDL